MATSDMCNTTACYVERIEEWTGALDCDDFPRTTIAGCYCAEQLRVFQAEYGLVNGASLMWEAEGRLCQVS